MISGNLRFSQSGSRFCIACRFLVHGFRSLAIQGIFQYNDKEYVMSEVPRNACQAEYNVYLQCAGR